MFSFTEDEITKVKKAKNILDNFAGLTSGDLVLNMKTDKVGILESDGIIFPLNEQFDYSTHVWVPHVFQIQKILHNYSVDITNISIVNRHDNVFECWFHLLLETFDFRWDGSNWVHSY